MNPIRCLLVGGPFDGAYFVIGPDDYLPEYWWIRNDPMDQSEFGLLASERPKSGAERYILSGFEGGTEAFYQHESLTTNVGARFTENVA